MEVTPFQESLLESGLWDFHEMVDQIPGCVDVPIGFASVMAGKRFEAIEQLTDDVIHHDLSKCSLFSCFPDISLQCSQSLPDFYQKWCTGIV